MLLCDNNQCSGLGCYKALTWSTVSLLILHLCLLIHSHFAALSVSLALRALCLHVVRPSRCSLKGAERLMMVHSRRLGKTGSNKNTSWKTDTIVKCTDPDTPPTIHHDFSRQLYRYRLNEPIHSYRARLDRDHDPYRYISASLCFSFWYI